MRTDTCDIFRQLAAEPADGDGGGGGVKCIIENHDAWVNSEQVQSALTAEVRLRLSRRDEISLSRIEAQRTRLARLVTPLRRRAASAG